MKRRTMNPLSKTWLTDGLIDFEYKKYQLLAYAQNVKSCYDQSRLYPYLADTIEHMRNLNTIRHNADSIKHETDRTLKGLDWQGLSLAYEHAPLSNDAMEEVNRIIDFALPTFQLLLYDGKALYDSIEKHLSLSPVGIMPLRTEEGYLFLNGDKKPTLLVYQYSIRKLEDPYEKTRILALEYISDFSLSIRWNYESVKQEIIRTHQALPNPAVYAIRSDIEIPFEETFLPMAKRYFLQHAQGRA
jgi:hypothetical protein